MAKPKISIVTPSLNQGLFLEQTIQSVLSQNYSNLEYIIIDGGSTDNTIDILKKYSSRLHYWVSEPDKGQSHALNKGFKIATGDILGYLNSDDMLESGSLEKVAAIMSTGAEWVCGKALYFHEHAPGVLKSRHARWPGSLTSFLLPFSLTFAQPSCFWSKDVRSRIGSFNEDIHFCMDLEYFLRARLAGFKPLLIEDVLSRERMHSNAKRSNFRLQNYKDNLLVIKTWGKSVCKMNLFFRSRTTLTVYLYLCYEVLRDPSLLRRRSSRNTLAELLNDYTSWLFGSAKP